MRAALLSAALLAGCYSASPPSGSYACNADSECPSNLQCSACAHVCVASPAEDVCSIDVAVTPVTTPTCKTNICVPEHGDLMVALTAHDGGGGTSRYNGPGTILSTWGHARPQPLDKGAPFAFQFNHGQAQLVVQLDRATPHNGTASLGAQVAQTVSFGIQTIQVDPMPFKSPSQLLKPGDASWASTYIGYPAVDRAPSGEYRMYVSGMTNPLLDPQTRAKVGIATSPDGMTWSVATSPLLSSSTLHLFGPSTLRVSPTELHLFVTAVGMTADEIDVATSSDGLTFGNLAPALTMQDCTFCTGAVAYPWSLIAPQRLGGEWLLYFTTQPMMSNPTATTLGVARSSDSGVTWTVAPIPAPASGQVNGNQAAGLPRILYDDVDGLFRMWYAELAGDARITDICKTEIAYGTSEDGLLWAGAGDVVLKLADVPWAVDQAGLYPGSVERDEAGGFRLYFSPVENLLGLNVCLPKSVGVASTD